MLYGAVEVEAILEYQDNVYPGARPTPHLRLRLVDSIGASVEVLATVYAAERLLRQLGSAIDQITLLFRDQSIGSPQGTYARDFTADPTRPPTKIEQFREFKISLLTRDQYERQLREMGLPPSSQPDGELDMLLLTIQDHRKVARTESSFTLDLWSAAGLRDDLHAGLSIALPPLSPSYRPVQTVDGVVGSIAM